MRILFVSPRQCLPATSGAKLRDYHFARGLGTRATVTYVYFTEPGSAALTLTDLPFCDDVVAVPPPRRYTLLKILKGVLGPLPLPLLNYTADLMEAALRGILRTHAPFDLIHLDSIHMMPYEHLFQSFPVVYNWHNIESEAMFRYVETAPSRGRRAVAALTSQKLERAEKRILKTAFGHIVCSAREQTALQLIEPGARVEVVHNGVDLQSYRAQQESARRFRLVFVGSMSYHANSDGALWFTSAIWPAVHQRHPEWTLTLVGSNPPPSLLALNGQNGIEVTGTVPKVQPYYAEALAAIVPLRTGGGTRLKILEAMAASVPVIATELGAEGLPVRSGRNILLVRTEDEWLDAFEAVTGVANMRAALIAGGQTTVADFDWELLGESLFKIYSGWRDRFASSFS